MKQFDALITNPPYANSSHDEKKNTLWRQWFEFDKLIKNDGVFAEIIPSSWMGSHSLIKEYFLNDSGVLDKNITFINRDECEKHFPGVGSNFSYFIYNKTPYKNNTKICVKNIDNTIQNLSIDLNSTIFDAFPRDLDTLAISILNKTLKTKKLLGIQNTTVCHANNKNKCKQEIDDVFKYPIEKTPGTIIYYNKQHPHQFIPKIVIPTTTYFRSMYYTINGTSQSFCYYNLKENENKDIVLNNLNNKLFDYINECFRYSNWNSVNLLKKLPNIPFDVMMSDDDIYNCFNLTFDEIKRINTIITWR